MAQNGRKLLARKIVPESWCGSIAQGEVLRRPGVSDQKRRTGIAAAQASVWRALREVHEETGLTIQLEDGFRQSVEYYPRPNIRKQVVYFLGYADDDRTRRQEEEISEIRWVPLKSAHREVTFRNDKNLINHAKKFLRRKFSHWTEWKTAVPTPTDSQTIGE